mgnify:CR=1 FL=1
MEEDKLLVRIAEMYYQEDKNQSQIAAELNIHRTTISRLLKKSREEGIVQITINYDLAGTYSTEQYLEKEFGLQKAIVIPVSSEAGREQKDRLLGAAASDYLLDVLQDNMTIGFSWGQSLAALISELGQKEFHNIVCLPMIGGPSGKLPSEYHVNTITYEAAKKINGRALLIDSPAIPETPELKKSLMENAFNQELMELWETLDVAVFGIGSPYLRKKERWQQFYGEDVLAALKESEVTGDIVSRFYNSEGQQIISPLDDRVIGLQLETLKKAAVRLALAESLDKARAILGALKGGFLTTLVTTEETAQEIMRLYETEE